MPPKSVLIAIVAGFLFIFSSARSADLVIVPAYSRPQPIPLALPNFAGQTPGDTQAGEDVAAIVRADLDSSFLFKAVDTSPSTSSADPKKLPDFDALKAKANALLEGTVQHLPDGRLRAEIQLWDVPTHNILLGHMSFAATPAGWRRIAHLIADAVYRRVTGWDGYFDTMIVYVAEDGPPENRARRLAIMDQDGGNLRFLTDRQDFVRAPQFSPNWRDIAYLGENHGAPSLFLYHLIGGQSELTNDLPGITSAPRFSPDGKKILVSARVDQSSNLYEIDLQTHLRRTLTNDAWNNMSPSYSPSGGELVFTSDHGGTPQIYTMNVDGSNRRRISFGVGQYETPVWSPKGDLIAFTKTTADKSYIAVMRPDGQGERLLDQVSKVDSLSWAPTGRLLIFRRSSPDMGGSGRLYTVDLDGNERQIPTPSDGADPAWSPGIP